MVSLETVQSAIGTQLPALMYHFSKRDTVLYALGIGAPADPLEPDELKFVYERDMDFVALPTMPVIYGADFFDMALSGEIAGIQYNPMMLVHGEQALTLHAPLPVEGAIQATPTITDIFDKGSGMLLVVEMHLADASGQIIATATSAIFLRGMGGFGGERGSREKITLPPRMPDAVHTERTDARQALIYRLSGDYNPLHIDPQIATFAQFDKPILHGLATYGYAGRAVLKHFCDNIPNRLGSLSVRFSNAVYPGETLITEMWQDDERIILQTRVKERDVVVLDNAQATLKG